MSLNADLRSFALSGVDCAWLANVHCSQKKAKISAVTLLHESTGGQHCFIWEAYPSPWTASDGKEPLLLALLVTSVHYFSKRKITPGEF